MEIPDVINFLKQKYLSTNVEGKICLYPDNGYDETFMVGSVQSYTQLIINLLCMIDNFNSNNNITEINPEIIDVIAKGLYQSTSNKNEIKDIHLKCYTFFDELFRGSIVRINNYGIAKDQQDVDAIIKKKNYEINPLLEY